MNPGDNRIKGRFGSALLNLCLLAFPRDFRINHARDLRELYHDLYGHLAAPVFWFCVVRDSTASGLAERVARYRRIWKRNRADHGHRALVDDLAYAAVGLKRSPGYTAVVTLTMALGVGLNLAIFAAVYTVLLSPPPFTRGDDLVSIDRVDIASNTRVGFSPTELSEIEAHMSSLDALVEYHTMDFTLLGKGYPERLATGVVSYDFFSLLGVEPILGRGFRESDQGADAEPVILLSYEYWRGGFGSDPYVVGKTYQMNDREHRVVGVLPPLPHFPQPNDIFVTASSCPFRYSEFNRTNRSSRMVRGFGRLAADAGVVAAASEFRDLDAEMARLYPEYFAFPRGLEAGVSSLKDSMAENARPMLLALFATSLVLLFAVCTNTANMSLARSTKRIPEWSLRSAMGASRWRIWNQIGMESLLLSGAGGVIGTILALLTMEPLTWILSPLTPRAFEVGLGLPVVAATIVGSLVVGLLFCALPSIFAVKYGNSTRVEDHNHTAARGRGVLVSVQVGTALTLLIVSSLMLRSFVALQGADLGFEARAGVFAGEISLDWEEFGNAEAYRSPNDFYLPFLHRLQDDPAVEKAALSTSVPLFGAWSNIVGLVESGTTTDTVFARLVRVTDQYFDIMGVSLLGQGFAATGDSGQSTAVLSTTAAASLFGARNPIGQWVSMVYNGRIDSLEVVGVAADVRQTTLRDDGQAGVYIPLSRFPSRTTSVVAAISADSVAARLILQENMARVDPDQPLADFKLVSRARADQLRPPLLTALMISAFGLVAVVITTVGLAGVIGYGVVARRRELGIRLALGARRSRVLGLVMKQGIVMTLLGLLFGVPVALATSYASEDFLYHVRPFDILSYGGALALVLAVALLACWIPAREATAIDPASALRTS